MISSSPGSDRSRKPSMSSSSKYVPRSATVRSSSRCRRMKSANAALASSSRSSRFGVALSGCSTSASECAGSSESASTGKTEPWSSEHASANALAQVVLPAPPLPPKNQIRGSRVADEGIGLAGGTASLPLPILANLTQAAHQHGLALGVFLLGDVARLHCHLQLQQLVLDGTVVHQLLLGDGDDLLEAPANAGDRAGYRQKKQAINDQHSGSPPASRCLRPRAPA